MSSATTTTSTGPPGMRLLEKLDKLDKPNMPDFYSHVDFAKTITGSQPLTQGVAGVGHTSYRPKAGRRRNPEPLSARSDISAISSVPMSARSHRTYDDEGEIVKLNVGGTKMMTTRSTLLSRGATFFSGLLKGDIPATLDDDGYYFIDKDPDAFKVVLEYLRTGKWFLPKTVDFEAVHDLSTFLAIEPPPSVVNSNCQQRNDFLYILNACSTQQKPPRFNGGYFPNLDLYRVGFVGVDFQKCDLSNSSFVGCTFKRAQFDHADLSDTTWTDCAFENTKVLCGSAVLKDCKIKCRCYCGGKRCAFSFTGIVFENCDFFDGEEFERHPMSFVDCVFIKCQVLISLFNVSAPDIKLNECRFKGTEWEITYASPSQLDNKTPVEFLKSCMTKCRAESTIVKEVCEARLGEATVTDQAVGAAGPTRRKIYELRV
eukprot:TRINITY_DN114624_c0_g1_i1.p1 TRINITY_DN114624_c0_g1~~TRINITY_DN114624_c0_g1_i1.p1  ORF type:complete len:467 (+),score=19.58 TRINITY_DN114624_c0_g1_i1:116-1402(+)